MLVFQDHAGVAELADAQDLKSWVAQAACGFDSRPRHHLHQPDADPGRPLWDNAGDRETMPALHRSATRRAVRATSRFD
jgi:hypothetical protein